MLSNIRQIKSIVWAQGMYNFPLDSIVGEHSHIQIFSTSAQQGEEIVEFALRMEPDIFLFDSNIKTSQSWSSLLSQIKQRMPNVGLVPILSEYDQKTIQEFVSIPIDSLIYADKFHLELPYALRAYQHQEIYLNPQFTRILCSQINNILPVASVNNITPNNHQQQPAYPVLNHLHSPANMQTSISANLDQGMKSVTNKVNVNRGLLPTLTKREIEVLSCLAAGLNYKQISEKLFVSNSTVKTHVNNIFTKLNINNRTQAVLYALKHGIENIMPELFVADESKAQVNVHNLNSSEFSTQKHNHMY